MKILVIDVGGTHVKVHRPGHKEPVKIPSGDENDGEKMVADVKKVSAEWTYSAVSIGYPGTVVHDRPVSEPYHLGGGWVGFDLGGHSVVALRLSTTRPCRLWGVMKEGACSSWVWVPGWGRH